MSENDYSPLYFTANPLSLNSEDERNVTIDIAVSRFPYDCHENWIAGFAEQTKLKVGATEVLADLTLASVNYHETVFILHISDLTQNIWITNTHTDEKHILEVNQLFGYISIMLA